MLTILFCADIEKSKDFYEHYEGFIFKHQKIDNGPEHYLGVSKKGGCLELYPSQNREGRRAGQIMLVLEVQEGNSQKSARSVVTDPDGRKVLLDPTE